MGQQVRTASEYAKEGKGGWEGPEDRTEDLQA